MKARLNGILTLLLAFIVQFTFAQDKVISGVVTDVSGPLPGVNVIKKGTTVGVETDFDGNYSLKAKKGDILVFSFVGMETVEKTVGTSNKINVVLKESKDNVLEQVIVTGYSTTNKESQTGSSKQFKATVIESKATSDVTKALAGEVSGVQVINSNGQPGSSAKVRIRGIGSIGGVNDPLYVVDGVPFEGKTNEINQSDIETFTVLKDASATAIYGSRGANGVVVITTKKGKKGTSSITFESRLGISSEMLPRYDMLDGIEESTEFMWDVLRTKIDVENQNAIKDNSKVKRLSKEEIAKMASNQFFGEGIPANYNLWNQSGTDLFDANGKIKRGVTRRYTPGNWDDYLFQKALRTENTLKFSGGSEKTKYYTSVGYLDDNGYAVKTNFKRATVRANVNHEFKEWLKGSINMSFVNSKNRGAAGLGARYASNPFFFSKNIPSIYPVYERDADGNKVKEPIFGGYLFDVGNAEGRKDRPFANDMSPIVATEYDKIGSESMKFIGNQYLEATPFENFKISSRVGYEYLNNNAVNRKNPFYGSAVNDKGIISLTNIQYRFYTWTKMLTYKLELDDHKFDFLAAHEASEYVYKDTYASKKGLVNPFGNDLDNALSDRQLSSSKTRDFAIESYFGQLKYDFATKYLMSLTFRRDGSSKFSTHKWDNFGAVGLGWNMHKESFLMDSETIKEFKLRGSYGLTGSQGTANRTDELRFYYANDELYNIANLTGNPTLSLSSVGNPDLTWETAHMFQLGLDFNYKDIFEVTFDYYIKDTKNMFYNRRGGISLGYASIKVNDGEMRNSGFEFDSKFHIVDTNDFKLDFNLNGEVIRNEITRMPVNPATGEPTVLNGTLSEGRSVYDHFMPEWAGVDSQTGQAQWNSYYDDVDGDGKFKEDVDKTINNMPLYMAEHPKAKVAKRVTTKNSEATRKYVDKLSVPDVRGAFGLSADYKGVSFTAQMLYGIGGYIYDSEYSGYLRDAKIGTKNYHVDVLNRWRKPGDKTDMPRYTAGVDGRSGTSESTRFLTSMSFLALNNIKLGYTLPKSSFEGTGLDKVSLFLSGDNLWITSARKGLNPSTYGDTSTITYNPLSTITFGINVKL